MCTVRHTTKALLLTGLRFRFNTCCDTYKARQLGALTSRINTRSQSTESRDIPKIEDERWTTIYRFPYIVHVQMLNRLKLYQTCFVMGLVPFTGYAYSVGSATLDALETVTVLSTFAAVMLNVFGTLSSQLIGIMYINESRNLLRFGHLTFFGKRKDTVVHIDHIKPLSETEMKDKDIFLKFARYNDKEIFYFCVKYGGVQNSVEMKRVFGIEDKTTT